MQREPGEAPRIHTYAAGVLPWRLRDAYIYSSLVAFRHGDAAIAPEDLKRSAHYVHILAPRHGSVEEQLPLPIETYELVSRRQLSFDGQEEEFLIFFNPAPDPHRLSPTLRPGDSGGHAR